MTEPTELAQFTVDPDAAVEWEAFQATAVNKWRQTTLQFAAEWANRLEAALAAGKELDAEAFWAAMRDAWQGEVDAVRYLAASYILETVWVHRDKLIEFNNIRFKQLEEAINNLFSYTP